MLPLKPPTEEEAFKGQLASAVSEIDELIAQPSTQRYADAAQKLLETHDALDLAAALLNDMTKEAASQVPVKITPERPLPRRKRRQSSYRGSSYRHGNSSHRSYRGGKRTGQSKSRRSYREDSHGKGRRGFNIRRRGGQEQ